MQQDWHLGARPAWEVRLQWAQHLDSLARVLLAREQRPAALGEYYTGTLGMALVSCLQAVSAHASSHVWSDSHRPEVIIASHLIVLQCT